MSIFKSELRETEVQITEGLKMEEYTRSTVVLTSGVETEWFTQY